MHNIKFICKTGAFFGLIGGLLGSVIAYGFLVQSGSFITEKEGTFLVLTFLAGYLLIGMPVAGLTGVLYGLLRVLTHSLVCKTRRKLTLGIIASVGLTAMWISSGYFSETEPMRLSVEMLEFNSPKFLFVLTCSLVTVYLHSLYESAYGCLPKFNDRKASPKR